MTWIDVPDDAKCADCLTVINSQAPCTHMVIRQDGTLNRTYLYARSATPCFCQCGVTLVSGPQVSLSSRAHLVLTTTPVWNIRVAMGTTQPDSAVPPREEECDCGRYVLPEDMVSAMHRYGGLIRICQMCRATRYTSCHLCNEWVHNDRASSIMMRGNGDYVSSCHSCIQDLTRCQHCAQYAFSEDADECCPTDAFGVVEGCECYDCGDARRNVIHSYSFRPTPVFAGTPILDSTGADRTPYMGFELEVEVADRYDRTSAAMDIRNAGQGRIYLKEDGSIHNGFEIVTHPASLDWYLSEFPWQKIRDMRSARSIHTASNCGLHVHVSRAAFSGPSHDYRWFLFWYRNQKIMNLLAGRESTYAEYNATHRSTLKEVAVKSGNAASVGRYTAINTNGHATYEVRVFASTLYVNRLKAALQLVDGTVEYTRQLRSAKVLKDGGFAFDSFMEWMMSTNPRRYAELIRRVEDVTRGRNFQRTVFTTDSWRELDSYGRSRWVTRSTVTQDEKVSR